MDVHSVLCWLDGISGQIARDVADVIHDQADKLREMEGTLREMEGALRELEADRARLRSAVEAMRAASKDASSDADEPPDVADIERLRWYVLDVTRRVTALEAVAGKGGSSPAPDRSPRQSP